MDTLFSIKGDKLRNNGIYLGDSLNDEDLFSFMPLSVGMRSVEDNRASFTFLPKYITSGYGGDGFSEVVRSLEPVNS